MGLDIPTVTSVPIRATTTTFSLLSLAIGIWCLARRLQNIRSWRKLSIGGWLLVMFYIDSLTFIFVSIVIKDTSLKASETLCDGAILACLFFYMSSKVLIYYILVEKAHIVQLSHKPRLRSKLYLFNCFGMMIPFAILIALVFYYRIHHINADGICQIGIGHRGLVPAFIFTVVLELYVTALFLIPLRGFCSWKTQPKGPIHTIAFRTFIGCCGTVAISVINTVFLLYFEDEPEWFCFITCNTDILFTLLVFHWVTSGDRHNNSTSSYKRDAHSRNAHMARLGDTECGLRLRPIADNAIIKTDCLATVAAATDENGVGLRIMVTMEQEMKVEDINEDEDGKSPMTDETAGELEPRGSTDGIIVKQSWRHHSV